MTFDEFSKVELRVAKVLTALRVEGSEKLLKLQISLGGSDPSTSSGSVERQLVAGIGKAYAPEAVVGKEIVIVANLDPRTFTLRPGSEQTDKTIQFESQGMLLAAHAEDGAPILLTVDKEAPAGSAIS